MSCFIILTSLLCGCSSNNKVGGKNQETTVQEEEKTERASEYGEDDKPWGEYNYKKAGVLKDLEKNLDENFVTADFTVNGESATDKVKIYGTNFDTSIYEGKKVFLAGVKNSDVDEEYVLIKFDKDITLVDESLISSISSLDSVDNSTALNEVKGSIDSISNNEYKAYVSDIYNSKVNELNTKKAQDEKNRQEAEARAAQERQQQEAAKEQAKIQQQQQAIQNNSQPNGESVYVAASGNGKCYHNDPNCSKMNGNVFIMSREEAEQKDYRACKKCYK